MSVTGGKVVPILNYVSMDSQNIEIIKDIVISDTSLANIENFNKVQEIDTFNINNNRFLETIHSNVKTIRDNSVYMRTLRS